MAEARSPPSRGAWIEISRYLSLPHLYRVAPPRGGRGLKFPWHGDKPSCIDVAPPRGGRGLKLYILLTISAGGRSPPPRGGRGLKLGVRCRPSRFFSVRLCSASRFFCLIHRRFQRKLPLDILAIGGYTDFRRRSCGLCERVLTGCGRSRSGFCVCFFRESKR